MICVRFLPSLVRRSSTFASSASELPQPDPSATRVVDDENKVHTNVNLPKSPSESNASEDRVLRVQHAMLLCYHGERYLGMQFNTFGPSIEKALFESFVKAGLCTEEHCRNPHYYLSYNRASRTDSRVSALRQVVSLKIPVDTNIEKINEYLPSDIRVLGLKRTTKSFDAQKQCSSRSYCYIMPTFALCHHEKIPDFYENYRVDADTLLKTNQVFQRFRGGHRFHNYTEKRDQWDQRALRIIGQASVSNAFLMGNLEMVEFHVQGQSFMLHQIRRMVGMTIAIMRGRVGIGALQNTFDSPMMPTPTAPALGLMLEKQHFDTYNKKFGHVREPLVWDDCDEAVESFKMEHIVPHIVDTELRDKSMDTFLNDKLKRHGFKGNASSSKLIELGNWDVEDLEAALTEVD